MALTEYTDHDTIRAVLDGVVAADPVRGTLLGTIALTLTGEAWLATDGASLAVRSAAEYPVALAGPWGPADLAEVAGLLARLPGVAGISGEVPYVDAVVPALDRPVVDRMGQRLFRLDELTEPTGVGGHAAVADDTRRDLVRHWFADFSAEVHEFTLDSRAAADRVLDGGHAWLWCDPEGTPVSFAARRPVVTGSARIGPVYTPPQLRGHGYGSAVTAAASRSVLDDDAVPVLFTDLANPTSNKIYQLLGYVPVEDRVIVRF